MTVPAWLWFATIGGLVAIILADLFLVDHKPHAVTVPEATRWVLFYVALAMVFGAGLWLFAGGTYAGEFFAGYITEYSLSVDNLFVFVIIMATFKVPAIHQHRVLLIGIVIALIMRGIFIAIGAAAIARFSWVFYVFAAVLIYTAVNLARQGTAHDEEYTENRVLRLLRRMVPVTEDYHGAKSFVKIDGKRWATPMIIVMLAIGSTDLLFALDSIPAIFGLTQEAYLVFTANAFALMGLRQLYFLLGGLLERLIYLSYGLAILLAFIGVKLVLHALHENSLPFINGGRPVPVPEVDIVVSLSVIVGVLIITTIASLIKARRGLPARTDADRPGARASEGRG
ncbi:TerC family protein [Pseudonocardia asaccharolytica]|uniref:Tellurium resistance protein TerC n=1 Tax=Pseudonocardia asaccharolytica DSM 44247 = NBRC 16224 TaxID=1123024 RepID=A0A511D3X8_9PSEU|nr:TerC family protein [Pseudonocardia asaccharolytica]GEL19496.1 tellurium resistance protein TerC [Pseudonocardia asaccharolytica DSM 44247 = NBRC 16224]